MSTEMSDRTKPPKAGGKGGIHMPPIFGPAGSSASFHAEGNKTTLQMFAWLRGRGLDAFEYQCGRGVRVSEEAAAAIKREAEANGIAVSLHAPYYISLASADEEKRLNSLRYIHDSALAVSRMGGDRIVVHPGGLGGLSRPEAAAKAAQTLRMAQRTLDEAGLSHVHICPETMGKLNQLGDLEEVLGFCELDERFTPCIDFGHLNSRTHGGWRSRALMRWCWTPYPTGWGRNGGNTFICISPKSSIPRAGKRSISPLKAPRSGRIPRRCWPCWPGGGWSRYASASRPAPRRRMRRR